MSLFWFCYFHCSATLYFPFYTFFFCLYIESLHLTTSTLLATRSIHVQNWRLNRSCLQWHRFYVLIEVLSATCQFFYSGKRLKFPLERFFVLSPRWPYLMSIHDIAFWYPSDHIFTEIHISFRQWYYHLQYNKWFTSHLYWPVVTIPIILVPKLLPKFSLFRS